MMKRFALLCGCLLLCVVLLCGCDGATTQNDVSIDLNASIHTLDEFKHGDVHCFVTITDAKDPTATGSESKEEKTVGYVFDGQEAIDLYNLMSRSKWGTASDAASSTGTYARMLTLDFYTGGSYENAKGYYGSFSISNMNRVIASASPNDLALTMAQAPEGTYDALWAYLTEKEENIS